MVNVVGFRSRWAAVALSALLVSCGGSDPESVAARSGSAAAPLAPDVGAYVPPASTAERDDPAQRQRLTARRDSLQSYRLALPALPEARIAALTEVPVRPGVPRQVGLSRELLNSRSANVLAAGLPWTEQANGTRMAVIELASAGAVGLRVGLRVDRLPDSALVRFFAPDATVAWEYEGAQINATLARNRAAGDGTEAGATYWSPYLAGEEARVEIELPPGVDPSQVAVAVPRLSHMIVSPLDETVLQARIGESGSCEVDVNCDASWTTASSAVARMLFIDTGSSYLCSGTLLNDRGSTGTPYFLSANHCISTQASASSLQTYWFYKSTSCNVRALSTQTATRTGGATLLYASSSTDTSFMRLSSTPPSGVTYAGWSTTAPTVGTSVASIHHPRGDLQKISYGTMSTYQSCRLVGTANDDFTCSRSTVSASQFIDVLFTRGTTETGSSGGGLFLNSGSGQQLIGTLYGGSSSCSNLSGSNIYGRFDVAYSASLRQWLDLTVGTGTATPASGWWWNALEPGRGFAIERQGTKIFMAGFMYDTAGAAIWYAGTLTQQTNGTYSGDLLGYQGGQALGATYRAPTSSARVATVVASFSSSSVGSIQVTPVTGSAVTISLQRFPISSPSFQSSQASFQTGWWWNPSESGRGYFVEVQGTQAFVAVFTYLTAGPAVWYSYAPTVTGSGTTFSGTLQQYRGGQSLTGSYTAPAVSATAGTLSFSGSGASSALLTLPDGSRINLSRLTF